MNIDTIPSSYRSGLDQITSVQIGWNIRGEFREQIALCVDEMYYATLSTSYRVQGAYINLRDKTAKRPSFRRDISGYGRLFPGFPSQTALAR